MLQPSPPSRRIGRVTLLVAKQDEAVAEVVESVTTRSQRIFAFCNMHTFNLAQSQSDMAAALSQMTVFNDGIGIEIASKLICGAGFPDNLNGTDFTPAVLAGLKAGTRVYLLGSPPGVAEVAAERLGNRFPDIAIAGAHHGYLAPGEETLVVDDIRRTGTEILLIGMGNPRQELWAARHGPQTGAVILCVGAFLDFSAGRVPRAPAFVRRVHAEWLYRLAIEPGRLWRRYAIGGFQLIGHIQRLRTTARTSGGAGI